MAQQENTQQTQQPQPGEFIIQKIYLEDASVESPLSPAVFQEDWKPEANIELNTANELLPTPDNYKISLTITVKTQLKNNTDKTAFLIQIKQVGIFLIKNFPTNEMGHILNSFCPSVLFPYAREMLSNLVTRAGFPDLQLAPVNFDAMYAQSLQQQNHSSDSPTQTQDTKKIIQ